MKNLLATTALVTALLATPAMAETYVLDANGNFYDRDAVTYAHSNDRLIVLSSDTDADLTTYGERTTVVRDGTIDDYDVSIYVGDNNDDGIINYKDYQNRFGEDTVIIEQYSSMDGSTTVATTTTTKEFVPQNEGSSIDTRDPYGETDEFAANAPVEMGDNFVEQNEGSSIETRDPYGETDEYAANAPVEMGDDFVKQNEGSSIETRDPYGETGEYAANQPVAQGESYEMKQETAAYGEVSMDDDNTVIVEDSELSLWERFKANFQ